MYTISPARHQINDIHGSIPSIKTLSPIASPNKKQMVKSTSIVITSTSNPSSPLNSMGDGQHTHFDDYDTNTSIQTAGDDPIADNSETTRGDPPDSNCKTACHNGSWRFFRRDKVTPLKVENPLPTVQTTIPSSFPSFMLESPKHQSLGNGSPDVSLSNLDDYFNNRVHNQNSPVRNHSSNSNQVSINSIQNKNNFNRVLPLLSRQGTVSATDTAVPTFSPNNLNSITQIMPFNKSDTLTLPRQSSELGLADLGTLSVPRDTSWKSIDDTVTISTIHGPMSGIGSSMSISKSLGSRIRLSISDKSNFVFQHSPLGSRRRSSFAVGLEDSIQPTSTTCKITNLSTAQGRRWNAAMILALSVAPIIALLIQNCVNLYSHNAVYYDQMDVKGGILYSVHIGNVMHRTQIERGTSVLYVSTSGKDKTVNANLLEAYNETDRAILDLPKWISEKDPPHFLTVDAYWNRIRYFRADLWKGLKSDVDQVLSFYSDDNAVMERWIGKSVQLSTSGNLWRTLIAYYMMIISKEQAGVERALGGSFYAEGGFNSSRMQQYLQRKVTGENFLARSAEYVETLEGFLDTRFRSTELASALDSMRKEILQNNLPGPDSHMAFVWFTNMTSYLDLLKLAFVCRFCGQMSTEEMKDIETFVLALKNAAIDNHASRQSS